MAKKVRFVARLYGRTCDWQFTGRTRRKLALGEKVLDYWGREYEIVGVGSEGGKLVVTVRAEWATQPVRVR